MLLLQFLVFAILVSSLCARGHAVVSYDLAGPEHSLLFTTSSASAVFAEDNALIAFRDPRCDDADGIRQERLVVPYELRSRPRPGSLRRRG